MSEIVEWIIVAIIAIVVIAVEWDERRKIDEVLREHDATTNTK